MSVAAPMSLLRHLSNGASHSHRQEPPEHHLFHINITAPIHEEEEDLPQLPEWLLNMK